MVENQTETLRRIYLPLFRTYHVRMTIAGHDHLFEHWVERYTDNVGRYRLDHLVTGGGGAPSYTYRGEPVLAEYRAAGASANVSVEHLVKPGPQVEDNPHHFVIVQVDGDRLSLEVVGTGPTPFLPYGKQTIDLVDP